MFEVGKKYHGFNITEKKFVKELNADVFMGEHEKSGARLMYVAADDDNRVFNIGFKTIPQDDTGVMHILEHSVLNGSDKYPVREPFVELLKGSMQTFLNAMTYPDKTIYPVASCNEKDFENLIDVYLDAVLHPAIYNKKEIFLQEGWHYEPEAEGNDECFRGVVYNEMKGAMSSEDSILMEHLQNKLFPDVSCYNKNSGGDPAKIPNLTYEQFINTHKKFYHPENSYIYLYGNMDTDAVLGKIDGEYLDKYDRINANIKIDEQPDRGEILFTGKYDSEEDKNGATHYAFGFKACGCTEREKVLALTILMDALVSSNESPLKKALLEKGICQEVWGFVEEQIINPYVCIALKRCSDDSDSIKQTVMGILKDIADKTIDKSVLEASLNQTEFKLREADFGNMPAGLIYCERCFASWLYGGDSTLYLEYENALSSIREKAQNGYFEQLIREVFLSSNHSAFIKLVPDKEFSNEKDKAEKERIAAYREKIGAEGVKAAEAELEKLRKMQNAVDSPEALATIPVLDIADIDRRIAPIPEENAEENGIKIRYHEIDTRKISYQTLYFDLGGMNIESLGAASFAAGLFGKVGTKKHSAADVINLLKTKLGSFSVSIGTYESLDGKNINLKLVVSFSSLLQNIAEAAELVGEIIRESCFDNVGEISKILAQDTMNLEMWMASNGQYAALARVRSYFTATAAIEQLLHGVDYYNYIKALSKNFGENEAQVLGNVLAKYINKDNLLVSITGDKEVYEAAVNAMDTLSLSSGEAYSESFDIKTTVKNEGVAVSSDVSYVAKGASLKSVGEEYDGEWHVLAHIMSYDYLWNTIRAKGGAYGTGLWVGRDSGVCFYSYRDPNVKKTLDAYDDSVQYLKDFCADEREMAKNIIGTVASSDRPKSPRAKASMSDSDYFCNISHGYHEKIRAQMLDTTCEKVTEKAEMMKKLMDENMICVFSSKSKLEANKDLFDSIISVK